MVAYPPAANLGERQETPGTALFAEFLSQAPTPPQRQAIDPDGTAGAEWDFNGRIIQLENAAGSNLAEWYTWQVGDPPEDQPAQCIDLTDPETWHTLLEQLRW